MDDPEQISTYKVTAVDDWTETEKAVRSVLSRISTAPEDRISRNMTIFQLGLDSINAVQVAAMLREAGFSTVMATDVLENPSCAKLAPKLVTASTRTEAKEVELADYDMAGFQERAKHSLQRSISDWEAIEAVLPCTALQMGMVKEFLDSKGREYFNFISLQFDQGFNSGDIVCAWSQLSEVHEILRTGFTPLDLEDASFAMLQYKFQKHEVPVSAHTGDHGEFSLAAWKEQVTADTFNHMQRPPWRVAVVTNPSDGMLLMHLAIHHAIYDAQSLQFLFTDLNNALSGRSLAPRRSNISVVVQDVVTQVSRGKEQAEAFWKKQAPLAVINRFPVMTPLKEGDGHHLVKSKACSISLPTLVEHVKNAGVTIQAVAQAAWLRILASYLGETSVVFGTILSGRNSGATRDAIFPCITTLPVIGQYSSSNRDALQAMMGYGVGLQRHQRSPLTDIQRWVGHPSTRLFDTLLVYQKFDLDGEEETRPWRVQDEQAAVDYPVSMEIEQNNHSVDFRITFASNVLPVQQAELLLEQFDAVFCTLAEYPDGQDEGLREVRPDLFSILPANEPELKSSIRLLHEFVEASAQQYPNKVALEFVSHFQDKVPVSRQWTYRELCANGNRVANMLREHTKTGDIVAVCFEKCPEAHFAMLGILKAGCALLALDPGAPSSRKEFILQDSGAAVLLTDRERSLHLDFEVGVPVISVCDESLREAIAAPPQLSRPLEPDTDRSYCLYTSGTTGTPKGCEITHENAVQAMLAFQKLFEGHWDENSRWLQFASYHFDVSVLEQYWTWSVGITLFAAPRDVILEDLVGTISTLQITHIDLTPSLARLVHPDEVPSLCRGVFITGGEQLKQEILDVWGPRRAIHNFYGPTEATIGVTTYPRVPINGKASNIGKQFANVGSYVLRPGTEIPVLKGGVGELCVSGKLVGKGYLNREELTAERFPTLKIYDERVYRTGDLVRVLHDGCFDFLGRADDQIKLRGQRLEIGEINHCIRSGVPEIKDVVTVVVRNEKQQKDLLVTFVVTTQDFDQKKGEDKLQVITGREAQSISSKAQRACREKLPGYMVPTYVLMLPFIPLSPNNKAELKVLRNLFNTLSPEQLISPSSASSVTDLGDIGKILRRALSRMGGVSVEEISSSSSIFELGVDSISVMRLARLLKQEGMVNVTPATILRNPILADLAQVIGGVGTGVVQKLLQNNNGILEAKQAVEACQHRHKRFVCRALGGVKAEKIEYIAPCSALQQGMISRSRSRQDSGAYFNTFHYELAEDVSLLRLRSAWETLMRRYSILRTRFVSTTEGYVQTALKVTDLPWNEWNLNQRQELDTFLDEQLRAWIDCNNDQNIERPWALHVVNGRWLVMHIFHGIYDATSFDLMMDEVTRLYKGEEEDQTVAPSFLDALLHGPLRNLSFSRNFWVNHLQGINKPSVPLELSENPSDTNLSVSREIEFGSLERVRQTLGVTQQAIIQALWSIVMQRYCPSGPTFGVIVSGRAMELDNVENTVGPLFNTIPYHYRPSRKSTWSSVVRQCHEFNTAVLPFQHVPLRDIQKWCSGGRPVFDMLFSFQRQAAAATSTAEGVLWREVGSGMNPDYPLAFEATLDSEGVLQILIVAQKGVADEGTLSGLLYEFESKAGAMVEDPEGLCHAPDDLSEEHQENSLSTVTGESTEEAKIDEQHFEWTPQAQAIRQQMALLSEVDETSVTELTTLLELGLDSIDTVKLSARLKRNGVSLSNSDLIKGQNIANLTALLADRKSQAKGTPGATDSGYSSDVEDWLPTSLDKYLVGSDLSDVEQILPPTPLQDSMVSEMINSDFELYFNHDVLQVSPDTDIIRLKEAWATVFRNTPILQTSFVEVESQEVDFAYMQVIHKAAASDHSKVFGEVEVHSSDEIASIKTEARERALRSRGQSGLFQVTFVKSSGSEGTTYVVLSIAHALYDGWSLGLLHRDVEAAYHGTYEPRPSYIGYLRHQILRSSRKGGALDFWSDYISDARRTILPLEEGPVVSPNNKAESVTKVSSASLRAFCRRHAISQQALAQACWAAVLATYSRRLDVTFGVVLSGRETEASEAMLFPTMNTVPVRAVFHGSVSGFLRYMQENMTNVSQFQHYPLRKIQALAQNGQGSLFNTLFILQKGIGETTSRPRSEGKQPLMVSVEGTSAVEYPICVELEVVGEELLWRTACDNRCLSSDCAAQLLKDVENAMDFIVNSSDEDILKFGDDGHVSICGLTPFQPQESQVFDGEHQKTTNEGDGDEGEWSPVEQTIRSVLAKMADVEPSSISKRHNLYHLGLDSIRAIKVSSALRKRGVAVTVRDLIQATSIQDMATKVSATTPAVETTSSSSPSPSVCDEVLSKALSSIATPVDQLLKSAGIEKEDNVEEVLPVTAMQTHMLSVWQNTNGAVFYPEFRYRITGIDDKETVEGAWKRLVEQSPILRTVFLATGSSSTVPFVQVVLSPNGKSRNPFVSFAVCEENDGEKSQAIRLKIHHALYDGVSLPILLDRFKGLLMGADLTMDSKESLASWKSHLASSYSTTGQAFWTNYLRGSFKPPSPRSTDSIITDRLSILQRSAICDTANLKSLCTQQGVSLQAVFFAAYALILADNTGQADVVFGVYLANRGSEYSVQQLPYPTLCLVPLRVRVSTQLFDMAAQIQKDLHQISARGNVEVGLWAIRKWTGVVVDSFVNFLSLPIEVEREGESRGGEVRLEAMPPPTDGEDTNESTGKVVDPSTLEWVQRNAVRDAYPVSFPRLIIDCTFSALQEIHARTHLLTGSQDAVDIEASIQSNGAMDIGVFGSRSRLGGSGQEAENRGGDMMKRIVDGLLALS